MAVGSEPGLWPGRPRTERLRKHGLIKTSNGGYCLAEWITVRDGGEGDAKRKREAKNGQASKASDPLSRRERILAELEKGQLRAPALAAVLKCSVKTVQRELDALRKEELVEFEGSPRAGGYRLMMPATL